MFTEVKRLEDGAILYKIDAGPTKLPGAPALMVGYFSVTPLTPDKVMRETENPPFEVLLACALLKSRYSDEEIHRYCPAAICFCDEAGENKIDFGAAIPQSRDSTNIQGALLIMEKYFTGETSSIGDDFDDLLAALAGTVDLSNMPED